MVPGMSVSPFGGDDDVAGSGSEEELLDEVGEGEPGPRPDTGAGGEEPAAP